MAPPSVSEVLVGVYLGLIAAPFRSLIAFVIGGISTSPTHDAGTVVASGSALAGVTGGLMRLVDPVLGSWTGIVAVLVILMGRLRAHSQGDNPSRPLVRSLRETSFRPGSPNESAVAGLSRRVPQEAGGLDTDAPADRGRPRGVCYARAPRRRRDRPGGERPDRRGRRAPAADLSADPAGKDDVDGE